MTRQWRVSATYAQPGELDDDTIDRLYANLPGFAIGHHDGARLTLEMTVEAPTIRTAAEAGVRAVRQAWTAAYAKAADPIGLRVLTLEEYEHEIARPYGMDLVGYKEIAEILGVTPQRAAQLAEREDFPPPIGRPAMGPVYTRASIADFAERWDRKPGRPRRNRAGAGPVVTD